MRFETVAHLLTSHESGSTSEPEEGVNLVRIVLMKDFTNRSSSLHVLVLSLSVMERAGVALETVRVGEVNSPNQRHLVIVSQVVRKSGHSGPF